MQPLYYRKGDKVMCWRCGRIVGRHNYSHDDPAQHKCPHGERCPRGECAKCKSERERIRAALAGYKRGIPS